MKLKLKDVSFAKAPNTEFAKTFDNILLQVTDNVKKMCPTHFATLISLMEGWHKYSRKNRKYSKSELLENKLQSTSSSSMNNNSVREITFTNNNETS